MTAGTSSGRRQSAIIIPVPDAEAVVKTHRLAHDPVAIAGVPAHITLVVPWLPPGELRAADLEKLSDMLAGTAAFEFRLTRARWFGDKVLWLEPEPAKPFVELTELLAREFETPPYDGEYGDVVPHLTVAHAAEGVDLGPVAEELERSLPLPCRADEVWVMAGDGRWWTIRWRVALFVPGSLPRAVTRS